LSDSRPRRQPEAVTEARRLGVDVVPWQGSTCNRRDYCHLR
jgi:hypothetical protein